MATEWHEGHHKRDKTEAHSPRRCRYWLSSSRSAPAPRPRHHLWRVQAVVLRRKAACLMQSVSRRAVALTCLRDALGLVAAPFAPPRRPRLPLPGALHGTSKEESAHAVVAGQEARKVADALRVYWMRRAVAIDTLARMVQTATHSGQRGEGGKIATHDAYEREITVGDVS